MIYSSLFPISLDCILLFFFLITIFWIFQFLQHFPNIFFSSFMLLFQLFNVFIFYWLIFIFEILNKCSFILKRRILVSIYRFNCTHPIISIVFLYISYNEIQLILGFMNNWELILLKLLFHRFSTIIILFIDYVRRY